MMRNWVRLVTVFALMLCAGTSLFALPQADGQQSQSPQADENPPAAPAAPVSEPKAQFFAGTVTTVDATHIVVSRTLVGKAPESRTFLLQPKTKTNRALKIKQRVTVRYRHLPEGDVALEVLVKQPRARNS